MVKRTTWMRMKQVTLCLESFGNKQHPASGGGVVVLLGDALTLQTKTTTHPRMRRRSKSWIKKWETWGKDILTP